jgi:uncharacterized protein YaaW (UPF0174 family)
MSTGQHFFSAFDRVTTTEVEPLAKLLGHSLGITLGGNVGQSALQALWKELSYLGSHGTAYLLRGRVGVDYPEIVRDVCTKVGVKSVAKQDSQEAVEQNELELLKHLFEDMWDAMSVTERERLLESFGAPDILTGAGAGVLVAGQLAAGFGGFGTYQLAVIVANTIARALVGRGLTFGANAALTQALGVIVGPIGWVASGAWIAIELTSPAFRKTLPAVVQVATFRQLSRQRQVIGVMGHGSVGKDSVLKHVFGVDTDQVSPIPGATEAVREYDAIATAVPTRVMNFPGFGDLRASVRENAVEQARACSSIVYVIDRIPQKEEVDSFQTFCTNPHVPCLVLFNKWDKMDEDEMDTAYAEACRRLGRSDLLRTSFKQKPGNRLFEQSTVEVRNRIDALYTQNAKAPPFRGSAKCV